MSSTISIQEAEKRVFKTTHIDGLWDVMLGCVFLMFALAPLLSPTLGDFWSSAIFLPFWALVYLAILLVRRNVIAPRTGSVKLGPQHQSRIKKFSRLLIVINLIALALGILVAAFASRMSGMAPVVMFGSICLIGFSVAAYLLEVPRFYLYGLLAGLAPLVGEYLYRQHLVSHHGFPLVFGFLSALMITVGLALFARLMRTTTRDAEDSDAQRG